MIYSIGLIQIIYMAERCTEIPESNKRADFGEMFTDLTGKVWM